MRQDVFLVFRQDRDSKTVAVVKVDFKSEPYGEKYLRQAITRAVTQWIKSTDEGRCAWKQSSEDFNVGDLSAWQSSPVLGRFLVDNGVYSLVIETYDAKTVGDWQYDDVLADIDDKHDGGNP